MVDMQLAFEDIDATTAQEYLALNIDHNRTPMNDRIERMARDMRNGDWVATADPIKFNTAGKLIDGQHRLRAILMSKTTQRLLVARDVTDDAVYVIDTGATRSAAQALKIADADLTNTNTLVAVAQLIHQYESGFLRNTGNNINSKERMTNAEVIRFIEENREALETATRMAKWVAKNAPLATSVLGAAYYVLAKIDPEQASMFYSRVREGSAGFTVSDPVTTLVRRLYQDKLNQRRVIPAQGLFYIFRTWNAWRDEESLTKIQSSSHAGFAAIPQPR